MRRRSLFEVGLESLALEEGLLGGAKVAAETVKREVIFLVTITWVESTFPPRGTSHRARREEAEEKVWSAQCTTQGQEKKCGLRREMCFSLESHANRVQSL